MTKHTRTFIAALTTVTLTLAPAAQVRACWWLHSQPAVASEAPVYTPAPPVATQVNYVPQTSYRTMYRPVAVTSYRPITTTDPCTGCPVTSMAPVTSYVQRPVVVPVTTYRPVVTTVQMPVTPACGCSSCGCSSCGTGACGAMSWNAMAHSSS